MAHRLFFGYPTRLPGTYDEMTVERKPECVIQGRPGRLKEAWVSRKSKVKGKSIGMSGTSSLFLEQPPHSLRAPAAAPVYMRHLSRPILHRPRIGRKRESDTSMPYPAQSGTGTRGCLITSLFETCWGRRCNRYIWVDARMSVGCHPNVDGLYLSIPALL